jgi:hypothetical protein
VETTFRATWDWRTRVLTGVVFLILVGCTALVIVTSPRALGHAGALVLVAVVACFDLALVATLYLLAPKAYTIRSGALVIRRGARDIVISSADIAAVELDPDGGVLKGAIRLCASGGALGFFGLFRKSGFGAFRAYATRTTGLVIIRRTRGEPVVVSPDDPKAFAALLDRSRSRPES